MVCSDAALSIGCINPDGAMVGAEPPNGVTNVDVTLLGTGSYYWAVRAILPGDVGGWGPYSAARNLFVTSTGEADAGGIDAGFDANSSDAGSPPPIVDSGLESGFDGAGPDAGSYYFIPWPTKPFNGDMVLQGSVRLHWASTPSVGGTVSYQVMLCTDATLTQGCATPIEAGTSTASLVSLTPGTYYWGVRAMDSTLPGWGPLSTAWKVVVTTPVCSDGGWCWNAPLPQGNDFNAAWASGPSDIWLAGNAGTLFHFDGSSWTKVSSATRADLYGLWGSSPQDVWGIGSKGTVIHWNGSTWSTLDVGTTADLKGIFGLDATHIWAVGTAATLLQWSGSAWTGSTIPTSATDSALAAVWASSPSDVWIVAGQSLLNSSGATWSTIGSLASTPGQAILWGTATDNVWVGQFGMTWHWDGTSLAPTSLSSSTGSPTLFWGTGPTDVNLVLSNGATLHWDGNWQATGGSSWASLRSAVRFDAATMVGGGEGGAIYLWDGQSWVRSAGSNFVMAGGVVACGPNDVWAVGNEPTHWDGVEWEAAHGVLTNNAAWCSASNDVWAGSQGGSDQIVHWNGTTWQGSGSILPNFNVSGFWGSSPSDVWAVGWDTSGQSTSTPAIHWNGSTWTSTTLPTYAIYKLWGSASNDIWGVGTDIVHWDGGRWSVVSGPPDLWLNVWGSGPSDVWAVGVAGAMAHWNGSTWIPVASNATENLLAVIGTGPNDVWASGAHGTMLHWTGSSWTAVDTGTSQPLQTMWITGQDVWAGTLGAVLRLD
jgi:hypothetical protein